MSRYSCSENTICLLSPYQANPELQPQSPSISFHPGPNDPITLCIEVAYYIWNILRFLSDLLVHHPNGTPTHDKWSEPTPLKCRSTARFKSDVMPCKKLNAARHCQRVKAPYPQQMFTCITLTWKPFASSYSIARRLAASKQHAIEIFFIELTEPHDRFQAVLTDQRRRPTLPSLRPESPEARHRLPRLRTYPLQLINSTSLTWRV